MDDYEPDCSFSGPRPEMTRLNYWEVVGLECYNVLLLRRNARFNSALFIAAWFAQTLLAPFALSYCYEDNGKVLQEPSIGKNPLRGATFLKRKALQFLAQCDTSGHSR